MAQGKMIGTQSLFIGRLMHLTVQNSKVKICVVSKF